MLQPSLLNDSGADDADAVDDICASRQCFIGPTVQQEHG